MVLNALLTNPHLLQVLSGSSRGNVEEIIGTAALAASMAEQAAIAARQSLERHRQAVRSVSSRVGDKLETPPASSLKSSSVALGKVMGSRQPGRIPHSSGAETANIPRNNGVLSQNE